MRNKMLSGMEGQEDFSFPGMKERVAKVGCFYQYRACKRDLATIYDIENIRHGVVYAQTPLNMNDPFDSMIGFSVEKIYNECIELLLDQLATSMDPKEKLGIKILLQKRLLGQTLEFVCSLDDLRKYIHKQTLIAHISTSQIPRFITENLDRLYKKCPNDIRKNLSKEAFLIFALIVKDYLNVSVEEKTIIEAFKIEEALIELEARIIETKDQVYVPLLKDFLSKLTVTCFSASGWDNQLMWSHYASAYSGICVEYDFEQMDNFIGFMYPVRYSNARPTVSLRDLGISSFAKDENDNLATEEVDIASLFSYLLSKNKCWNYEEEWRIINIEEAPYAPRFINAPFVKSITLGLKMDDMCRYLLWDVCQEMNIDCYQLVVNSSDYTLSRDLLTPTSFIFNKEREEGYLELISEHTISLGEKIKVSCDILVEAISEGSFESQALLNTLDYTLDFLCDVYFMKASFNRYCRNLNLLVVDILNERAICKAILQIDSFITQTEVNTQVIAEALLGIRVMNAISASDYKAAGKTMASIKELIEKHRDVQWFGREAIEAIKEELLNETNGDE